MARQVEGIPPRRNEEARFRHAAIVESSVDAIISKDLNAIITSWNSGAEAEAMLTVEIDHLNQNFPASASERTISIDSKPLGGTTIRVRAPVALTADENR